MKVKAIYLFLVLMLFIVFIAACSESSSNEQVNKTISNNQDDKETSEENVTFTLFNAGSGFRDLNTNETVIGKILEDQTGVNFEMEFLVGDINTKVGTMIAANEFPDVVIPDSAIDKFLDAGAFIPLNDLIAEHGPNIQRVYGSYYELMKQEDGNIYFLPFEAIVGERVPSPNVDQSAFWIQRRVLKEFGYPKIKTLDQYFQLIEDYEVIHKDEDLTGFISLTHDWRFFVLVNPANHLAGFPNDGGVMVDMETYEATVYADKEDSTKRWLQKLNEMNAKGLYDKSSFVDNYDQYLAKISSGKILGFFDYGWQVRPALQLLEETGNDDLLYMPMPIVFDEDIKDQYGDSPGFVDNRGIAITVSAEGPAKIIQYFDNFLTDENQILSNWGIEGETFEIDENGRFYKTKEQIDQETEEFRESFGLKYFEYFWPRYGTGSSLSDGNSVAPGSQAEVVQLGYTEGDLNLLKQYGVRTFAELFSDTDERPWFPAWSVQVEQGSPEQIFGTRSDELQRRYFPKLVLSNPSEFEDVWNEYVTEFRKLDVEGYENFMTEEIKKKVDRAKGN
ncbi:extracellular solute-binding protein [Chengkuizengella sediminis]|uniref:extracellular solute-binding protein n=1 Tax=Chengkuizengella sediminis TaxID=1885917 RepID=UPI00196B37A4|nr:extracellular solute-binding protein [Chengkuizengella sediminis]